MDIQKEAAEIRRMYSEQATTNYFRALIYGDSGTGKTSLLGTARKPVHVDSFDPGGSKVLRDLITSGDVLVDNRYELETPRDAVMFQTWEREYLRRKKEGYFAHIGTYALDSITTFSQAVMNAVMKKNGHPAGIPMTGEKGKDNDYIIQMLWMENALRDILTLPCDVIITAHPDLSTDDASKRQFVGPMITGQAKVRVPLMFDEMYATLVNTTPNSRSFTLLTGTNGLYRAKSRFSNKGQFELYEQQDIKALLKKAGYNTDDKSAI